MRTSVSDVLALGSQQRAAVGRSIRMLGRFASARHCCAHWKQKENATRWFREGQTFYPLRRSVRLKTDATAGQDRALSQFRSAARPAMRPQLVLPSAAFARQHQLVEAFAARQALHHVDEEPDVAPIVRERTKVRDVD